MQMVRRDITTLASPAFHGRGYVKGGDSLAARWLAARFDSLGLQPFQGQRLQPFTQSVVIFDGPAELKVQGRKLVLGQDYLFGAASPSVKGAFRIEKDLAKAQAYPRKLAWLVPSAAPRGSKMPTGLNLVISQKRGKLTHTIADEPSPVAQIILKDSLPPRARKLKVNLKSRFDPAYRSANVLGVLPGQLADSFIVVTAHYDHLGRLGPALFPGAHDNASGTTMLLQLARHFAQQPQRKYSILFIAFAGEEAGLKGSHYFVETQQKFLPRIKFLLNIDLMGGGDQGVTAVNGAILPGPFQLLEQVNRQGHFVPAVKPRGRAANSDHYFFSEAGVPALFIYTNGGVTAYHDIYDTADALPLQHYPNTYNLLRAFLEALQQ